MSTFIVIFDACVLYPAPLRDLLVRLAGSGLVQAKWTEEILDEVFRNILKQRADLNPEKLARTRQLMNEAVPDCVVTGYDGLADGIELPDDGDRHVLAAAIRCGAQGIVTANRKDFPAEVLEPLGVEAIHPDRFVLDLIHLGPGVVLQCIAEQASSLRNPPMSFIDLVERLESNGLIQSMAEVRVLRDLTV